MFTNDDFVRIVNMPVWISAERRTYGRQNWDGLKRGKTVDRDVWESASRDGYATLFERLASSSSFSSRNDVCRMTWRPGPVDSDHASRVVSLTMDSVSLLGVLPPPSYLRVGKAWAEMRY